MDLKPVFKLLDDTQKKLKKETSKRIKDDAKYLASMLRNAPLRAKSKDPKKQKSGNDNYVFLKQENLIWFPDPNGGPSTTDGTTVREFVNAIGKTTERSTYRTRRYRGKYVKGGFGWAEKQLGAEYDKGIRRATRKEKEYVAKLKESERKLKAADSKKLQKIRRQILKLEASVNRKKPARNTAAKLSKKRVQLQQKREQLLRERQMKLQQKQKPKHYRIVGEIPLEKTSLRAVRPDVVRTWFGDGGPEKYLGRRWSVKKVSDLDMEVSIHPLSSNYKFLRNIEHGGTFDPNPVLTGYTVFFEDTGTRGQRWNQRRVRFIPHLEDKKTAHVKPRHFVNQTVKRFHKERQKRKSPQL